VQVAVTRVFRERFSRPRHGPETSKQQLRDKRTRQPRPDNAAGEHRTEQWRAYERTFGMFFNWQVAYASLRKGHLMRMYTLSDNVADNK
jgi:hypothetical protein